MVEVLVSLGAVAYLGAWRLRWSFGLAQVFWWASIFAATDDPIIRYGWLSMMVLEIMTRNDFPHLRQIFTRPGRFIGSLIRSVIFNKGDRFQRLQDNMQSWAWLYDDYQSQDVARARSDRKEEIHRERHFPSHRRHVGLVCWMAGLSHVAQCIPMVCLCRCFPVFE